MLIKSQSEVRLHTGRSVHFHPGRCARPSFLIFQGSGSETTLSPSYLTAPYDVHKQFSAAVYLAIVHSHHSGPVAAEQKYDRGGGGLAERLQRISCPKHPRAKAKN